ncbi:MAG: hypothetical protein M3R65_01340 [Gemmatimonadota bacterium]|nr:hypothetical protein [Gemmatimonadota bacterium]
MKRWTRPEPILALAAAVFAAGAACAPVRSSAQRGARPGGPPVDTTDRSVSAAADAEMNGMGDMDMAADPHMVLTPRRPASAADSARALALVLEMRAKLAKYRDVRVAEADGFTQFLPNVPQPVYHFTNWRWAFEEAFRFNAAKPTSLLYRRNANGSFALVGVMYTAPRSASANRLDERVPLSVARWHEHVNWCLPRKGEESRWRDSAGGKPVFGPRSAIVTANACDAVGGRFIPHLFGWMVHANVFASDDPAVIWGHAQ